MASFSLLPRILLSLIQNHPDLLLRHLSRRQICLPVNRPLVGMLPAAISNSDRLHHWSTDLLRLIGCTFVFQGLWSFSSDVILTCDPANVSHVFNSNFANYSKGRDFAKIFDVLGAGIFVADSGRDKLDNSLIPLLDHVSSKGIEFDLQDLFLRLTFDTTEMVVFGIDPAGCLSPDFPTVAFAKAMDDTEEVMFYRHIVTKIWLRTEKRFNFGNYKKTVRAKKAIDESIANYISIKREAINKEGDDLLTSYLNSQAEVGKDGAEFDEFLRDTALNFMVAGRDTTSSALTWFFYLLSRNRHVEVKLLQEIKSHSATELREREKLDLSLMFHSNTIFF